MSPYGPSSCAHCGAKWYSMQDGKLRVPHPTPFYPGIAMRVICVPCFDELPICEIFTLVLHEVSQTDVYKKMPIAGQPHLITDLQHMIEYLKAQREIAPFPLPE